MVNISHLVIDADIHVRFVKFCNSDGHHHTATLADTLAEVSQQRLPQYVELPGKTKSLEQWNANANAHQIPGEAILAAMCKLDLGKLRFLKFIMDQDSSEKVNAGSHTREHFFNAATENYMGVWIAEVKLLTMLQRPLKQSLQLEKLKKCREGQMWRKLVVGTVGTVGSHALPFTLAVITVLLMYHISKAMTWLNTIIEHIITACKYAGLVAVTTSAWNSFVRVLLDCLPLVLPFTPGKNA